MNARLRIKLVKPSRYLPNGRLLKASRLLTPSLSLPLLAALTPQDVEVALHDEVLEAIDFDEPADLVGITAYTVQALRAYEIADEFRRRGVPVVMGGIHASMMPDEAAEHADTVIVGEAEETWPLFLDDFRSGVARERYVAERPPSLAGLPAPGFSLLDRSHYRCFSRRGRSRLGPTPCYPVQTARGCPKGCEFCAVPGMNGRRYRPRPIAEVIDEIQALGARACWFVDDDIFARPERARELFRALIPLGVPWLGQGTIGAAQDPSLVRLARESGCLALLIGLESLSSAHLAAVGKRQNVVEDYARHLAVYREHGIAVIASMIFGFGTEPPEAFDEACDFLVRNRVPYAIWWPLVPFPGTALYDRLRSAGWLKDDRWWLNPALAADFLTLKSRGQSMGEAVFRRRFRRAYQRFYSWQNIARRILLPPQERPVVKALINLLWRRRLRRHWSVAES